MPQETNFQEFQAGLKNHIPALDGLRAIAIIWVMLHNGTLDKLISLQTIPEKAITLIMNTGWMGVQMFFVLSGFLITGILLDAKKNNHNNIYKQFYMRRVLRIFPIYYVFLILAFIAAVSLQNTPSWLNLAYDHKWWYIFYTINWIQAFEKVGFSHFWSLAVEEQFYIFWPVIIISLSAFRLYATCLLLITLSITFRLALTIYDLKFAESAAYVFTLSRLDALAIGSLLAITLRDESMFIKTRKSMFYIMIISIIYILLTLASTHSFDPVSTSWTVLNQTMAALLFVSLIYYSLDINSTLKYSRIHIRILSLNWMRSIGKYSYAMYIFHLPVAFLLHNHLSNDFLTIFSFAGDSKNIIVFTLDLLLLFILTYCLAWCSWRLIELPFLNLKRHFPMTKQPSL